MIREEEGQRKKDLLTKKDGRLQEAQRLKRSWREWREGETDDEEEKAVEEAEFDPEYLGGSDFCMTCVMSPCCCLVVAIDRKIEMILF